MKKFLKPHFFAFIALCFVMLPVLNNAQDKLKADEIIAKHLDSIGSAEKRSLVKNQFALGSVQYVMLRSSASANGASTAGKAILLSEGRKVYYGSNFTSPNYPFEKVSFNGDQVNIAFIPPGIRSSFGNFIVSNKNIFSEGLFGGTLTSSWSLLDWQNRKAKISSAGKKKIEGCEAYVIEYTPKNGSTANIRLFFDAENFHHLRTEYKQIISAAQGLTPDASSRQMESRQQLIEEFGDYREESGLILPHTYRIFLSLDGQRGTNEQEWKFQFTNFAFNQNLDPKSFDISAQ